MRGAFNATKAPTLGALSLREAVIRAGIDPAEVDDVVFDILPHLSASRHRRGIPITG
ncbi:hypothetical protein [Aeromonas caviae]